MKYKGIIVLVLASLAVIHGSTAQVYERERHETRAFKVYDHTKLEIYNKYGNIHLFTWDVDSVKIDIDLKVRASKESKVEKIFEYIDFEFSNSKYYIIARTNFRQNPGSFWSELSDLANTVFSGNNKAQIDYHVYLPADMATRLENKFGNIYCTDLEGRVEVKLSNGDFKANNLKGETELSLSFGNASIHHIERGRIDGSYIEMELTAFDQLKINSKSSTYRVKDAGILEVESRRDKFYIDELISMTGKTSFSYLVVNGLSNLLQLDTEYGEIKLKGIHPSFRLIDLDSKYTDILFEVTPSWAASVAISYSETTGLYYPESYTGLTITEPKEKGGPSTARGAIGKPAAGKAEIKVSIQSGKIAFQEEIQLF